MGFKKQLFVMFMGLFLSVLTLPAQAKVYYVYFLAGQSNMDGYGYVSELTGDLEEVAKPQSDVWIFHGNIGHDAKPVDGRGVWAPLKAGHGKGFTSNGKSNQLSDRFGVELTFAKTLKQLRPNESIAIVKYSKGGTSIHQKAARTYGCWEPDYVAGEGVGAGINQYDHALATIVRATSVLDIDGDGERDVLIPAGIVWMQGESDGTLQVAAETYQANLKRLMDLLRAAWRVDDLPVVIGRISDSHHEGKRVWEFGDEVRQAQADFCAQDPMAQLVTSTDQYAYSDPWHYDTAGYVDLGKQFAMAMHQLLSPVE